MVATASTTTSCCARAAVKARPGTRRAIFGVECAMAPSTWFQQNRCTQVLALLWLAACGGGTSAGAGGSTSSGGASAGANGGAAAGAAAAGANAGSSAFGGGPAQGGAASPANGGNSGSGGAAATHGGS